MPDFPKKVPPDIRFKHHPPLAELKEVALHVDIEYQNWPGAYFPQLKDDLERMIIEHKLSALNLGVKSSGSSRLCVEVKIKTPYPALGVSGGIAVKVETFLQEVGVVPERSSCLLDVITWSNPSHMWLVFRARAMSEIVLAITGEVERQINVFMADYQRDNPHCARTAIVPAQPVCPPIQQPSPPIRLAKLWGANLVHLESCWNSKGFSNLNSGTVVPATQRQIQDLRDRKVTLFRIPIRWERLEPHFGNRFAQTYLDALKETVELVKKHGRGHVILALHNEFHYFLDESCGGGAVRWALGQQTNIPAKGPPISQHRFVRFWTELAKLFKNDADVLGFSLMNMPEVLSTASAALRPLWLAAYQAAFDAIRGLTDKLILVDATHTDWKKQAPWMQDTRGQIVYELHARLDGKQDAAQSIADFAEWCDQRNVAGFLASLRVDTRDPNCAGQIPKLRPIWDAARLGGCYWPAGGTSDHDLLKVPQENPVWRLFLPSGSDESYPGTTKD